MLQVLLVISPAPVPPCFPYLLPFLSKLDVRKLNCDGDLWLDDTVTLRDRIYLHACKQVHQ
ncbi:MAG: hypothetical protein AB3A66_01065 [Nodularia sp. CChRGM 3473]